MDTTGDSTPRQLCLNKGIRQRVTHVSLLCGGILACTMHGLACMLEMHP